jgi:lipopolysaccharide heptosyltransferase II
VALKIPAKRILVRCPNWVGDVVMATPALRCIRANYPDAHITLLMRPYVRKILEDAPWYDDIILYEPPRTKGLGRILKGIMAFVRAAREIRRKRIDLAVLLTHSFRSALLAKLGRTSKRLAYTRGDQSWLLTDSIPWPRENGKRVPLPKVDAYLGLCNYLQCAHTDDKKQELFFSEANTLLADELINKVGGNSEKPIFGIVPGASYGSSKFWDTGRFAQVADGLVERYGWQAALLCGPGEMELAHEIAKMMKSRPLIFPPDEFGLDILKPMIARCKALITTDTGPRHFGVAFEVPTVVIMGPTDPRHTQSDYANTVILRKDVPCGPCHKRTCPEDHACMQAITVDMVVEAVDSLIKEPE